MRINGIWVWALRSPSQVQDVLQVHAGLHGPEAGGLNGGAVGQGIGKRHAQFQDIGPPGGHLQGQGPGGGQVRVPGGDKGDEGLFASGLELLEHPVNPRHRTPPLLRPLRPRPCHPGRRG